MAIFSSSDNTASTSGSNTTIITEGSFIKGEMKLSCDLYVDGEFEGNITSSSTITVGKNGLVKGELKAEKLYVQGKVTGTVDAEHVEIKASGYVGGTIVATDLAIEPKGVFEGESKRRHAEATLMIEEA